MARVLMCFLLAACGACTAPLKDTAPPHETGPVTSLYLVSHGWHVGLVIRQADIPVSAWPWGLDFPEAEYLEVGWGDRTFYQALDPHLGSALKAALLPTESVLHVFGFSGSVTANFPYSAIIEIKLPGGGMQRLAGYIAASSSRDDAGNVTSLGGKFYRKALERCRKGRCDCPTDEYGKLDDVRIERDERGISVHLQVKVGQAISKKAIAACLDHTLRGRKKGGKEVG